MSTYDGTDGKGWPLLARYINDGIRDGTYDPAAFIGDELRKVINEILEGVKDNDPGHDSFNLAEQILRDREHADGLR